MSLENAINPVVLARADITAKLVLDLGCRKGAFARAYRKKNPNCTYIGVEWRLPDTVKPPAQIDQVVQGDIVKKSTHEKIAQALQGRKVDLLLLHDGLELMPNPTAVLATLREIMNPGGSAVVCVPNITHWSTLERVLKGDWSYKDTGLIQQGQRWFFTKPTAAGLFKAAGWHTAGVTPRVANPDSTKDHIAAAAPLAKHFGIDPKDLNQSVAPLQWVFALKPNPAPAPIRVHAIGIGTKVDALTKIRVRQPLSAMAGMGAVSPSVTVGRFTGVPDGESGVFLTYRLHPEDQNRRNEIDKKCRDGWLFVHDVDDHPAYLKGQVKNDFWSIKAAHAVTVSTPALAEVCRTWNPNVFVVENQIMDASLPPSLQQRGPKPRLFFGALNREDEWKSQCGQVLPFLMDNKDRIACDVIHEPSLYKSLNDKADATFYPTQTYENFMSLLAKADFALLPLFDTEFNRCKSDLKVIECLAHGVIPICSPFAAAQTSVPNEFLCVAKKPEDWPRLLDDLLDDPEDVLQRKKAGQAYVHRNRMWSKHGPLLAGLYESLLEDHPNLEDQRRARLSG